MKNQVILDSIAILADETIELRNEANKFWGERNRDANRASKMWYALYKSGELKRVAEVVTTHVAKDDSGVTVVDFVIESEKIEEVLMENGFDNLDKYTPCIYSGCIGLAFCCEKTYRDSCGVVSSSWEHPFVSHMTTQEVYALRDINAIDSGKLILETIWD